MENVCVRYEGCAKILEIQNEIDSYQKCVENSLQEISNLNIKYEKTVSELSSIINIFEYINLVTDYKNLFSIINDMLIGVIGASSSTIFTLGDEGFFIEASSIPRQQMKNMDKIAETLYAIKDEIQETYILTSEKLTDDFSINRGIKSAVVVPLNGKNKLIGLIYLEHVVDRYFEADDIKYLNTLAVAIRLSLENAQLYARLEEMALRDGLTELYNRIYFNKEIQNCMDNYQKYNLPFVLSILDIDHFKKVNDEYGHLGGDLVLKEVGKLLVNSVRKDDIVCRYGGEEFAIIFRNTGDLQSVVQRVEELRKTIESYSVAYNETCISVTCSFGLVISTACSKAASIEEIVRCADDSLYTAKRTGRNKVCVYDDKQ
ncbi:MAG: sensor domain-containing diguanylate cyclase [Bacillota bacterium]